MSGATNRFDGLAVEAGVWESAVLGPLNFATRLATYITDPARIRSMTVREYGTAPTLERCVELRQAHERRCAEFRDLANRVDAENDNGDCFRVRGIVTKPERPAPAPKLVKAVTPDGRIAHLAQQRAKLSARRKAMAINSGPTARRIIKATADYFELTPTDIIGDDRRRHYVSARHVAIRLLAEVQDANGGLRFSKMHIGRMLGNRDHSTILHALRVFDDRVRMCPIMAQAYEALTNAR